MMAEAKKRKDALVAYEKTIPGRMVGWEAGFSKRPKFEPAEVVSVASRAKAKLEKQPDGSILVSGELAAQEVYTVVIKTPLKDVTGLRLEVLPDKALPAMGPGRAPNGNFVLNELRAAAIEVGKNGKPRPVGLYNAQATFEQAGFPIGNAIDNNPTTGWAIAPQFGKAQEALFPFRAPVKFAGGAQFTVTINHQFGTGHNIGKFRLSVTGTQGALALKGAAGGAGPDPGDGAGQADAAAEGGAGGGVPQPGRGAAAAPVRGRELRGAGRQAAPRRAGPGVGR